MRARAGLIPAAIVVFTAAAAGSVSAVAAPAEENCLAAPSGKPPEGSHWHYRTDPATQTKCWYLRPAGETAQKPAIQDKAETGAAARSPATPKAAPDQAAAQQPRPAQATRATGGGSQVQGSPQDIGGHQALNRSAPWPNNPPAQAGAGAMAWPEPAQPAAGAAPQANSVTPQATGAGQQPTGAAASQANGMAPPATGMASQATETLATDKQDAPATVPDSDQVQGNNAASDSQVAAVPVATAAIDGSEIPLRVLLALAISLLVSGIIVRRLVRVTFARRVKVAPAPQRREPALRPDTASDYMPPRHSEYHDDFDPGWVDRLDGDVQAALRNLLRTLERQAA